MTIKQLIKELETHPPKNEAKVEVHYQDGEIDRELDATITCREETVIITVKVPRKAGSNK